jgi:hypothetical protein
MHFLGPWKEAVRFFYGAMENPAFVTVSGLVFENICWSIFMMVIW